MSFSWNNAWRNYKFAWNSYNAHPMGLFQWCFYNFPRRCYLPNSIMEGGPCHNVGIRPPVLPVTDERTLLRVPTEGSCSRFHHRARLSWDPSGCHPLIGDSYLSGVLGIFSKCNNLLFSSFFVDMPPEWTNFNGTLPRISIKQYSLWIY